MMLCKVAAVVARAKVYTRTISNRCDAAGSPHVTARFLSGGAPRWGYSLRFTSFNFPNHQTRL